MHQVFPVLPACPWIQSCPSHIGSLSGATPKVNWLDFHQQHFYKFSYQTMTRVSGTMIKHFYKPLFHTVGNHLKLAGGRAKKRPVMSVVGLHFTFFCRHSPLLLLGRRKETTVYLVFQKEVCKRGLPVSSEEAWIKSMCVSLSPHPKTSSLLWRCCFA